MGKNSGYEDPRDVQARVYKENNAQAREYIDSKLSVTKTFVATMERNKPKVIIQRGGSGEPFQVVKVQTRKKTIVIPSAQDLSQQDYDDAKKLSQNTAVLEKMQKVEGRYVSPEEIQHRVIAEKMKNSNSDLLDLAGGKQDFNLRSVIGLQNLKQSGGKSNINEGNYAIYKDALSKIDTGLTDEELVKRGIQADRGVGAMIVGTQLVIWGAATGDPKKSMVGKRVIGMAVGAGASAAAQKANKPQEKIDLQKVVVAGATGVFLPLKLGSAVSINVGGSVFTDGMQGNNPNTGIVTTSIGTIIGFKFGDIAEKTLEKTLPKTLSGGNFGMREVGRYGGMVREQNSKVTIPYTSQKSPYAAYGGIFGGGVVNEAANTVSNNVADTLNKK